MISNKHANNGSKTKTTITIPDRATSIIKADPQKDEMKLEKSIDSKTSTPRRGRTHACTSIDEVAKAFDVDVKDGKLTERNASRN